MLSMTAHKFFTENVPKLEGKCTFSDSVLKEKILIISTEDIFIRVNVLWFHCFQLILKIIPRT
jgi:hypothetical protein